jgi:hypothetical protein
VLLIFEPFTLIATAINVSVNTASMCLIVLPVTLIDVTIGMNETPATVCLVILPVTFIARAVKPDLNTASITDVSVSKPKEI